MTPIAATQLSNQIKVSEKRATHFYPIIKPNRDKNTHPDKFDIRLCRNPILSYIFLFVKCFYQKISLFGGEREKLFSFFVDLIERKSKKNEFTVAFFENVWYNEISIFRNEQKVRDLP